MNSTIYENIQDINKRIAEAAQKSGRASEDITFVCVTKTIDVDRISEAIHCGITELGENRVQELTEKFPLISGVNWHLIGHLQTNKVKYIIDKVKLIHSVDSVKLAQEIQFRAKQFAKTVDVLVEINIANEPTKFGVLPSDTYSFVKTLSNFDNINVKGFMTIAPNVDNSEKNRNYFKKMFEIMIDINGKIINNSSMTFLSMGMTNDYVTAIEEGANIVRVGSGVFGVRR